MVTQVCNPLSIPEPGAAGSRVPRPQPLPLRGLRAAPAALRKPEPGAAGSRVPRPQPLPLRGLRAAPAALRKPEPGAAGSRVPDPNHSRSGVSVQLPPHFGSPSQERLGVGSTDPNPSRSGVSVRLSPHFGKPARSAGRFGRGAHPPRELTFGCRSGQAPPFRTARPWPLPPPRILRDHRSAPFVLGGAVDRLDPVGNGNRDRESLQIVVDLLIADPEGLLVG